MVIREYLLSSGCRSGCKVVYLDRNVVICLMVDVVAAVTSRVVRFGYLGIRCCFSVPKGLQRRRSLHLTGLGFLLRGVAQDWL